jgi:tRNA threonylcarbamoyladenosine biosynthesis protein TsaE
MTYATQNSIQGEHISCDPAETFKLGRKLGEQLSGGEILLLNGSFGAGKTILTKGIAAALGIDENEITSPSFTLVNRHDEGRLTLYHLDLYRLPQGFRAAEAVDLEELLSDEQAVIVIEWAERIEDYPLPPPAIWRIEIENEEPRRVRISRPSSEAFAA